MFNKVFSFGRLKNTGLPALLFGVILTAVLVGCFGDFAPMAPSNDDVQVGQPNWLTYDMPDQPGAAKVILTASATITSAGGLVSGINVGSALEISLDVPPQLDGSSIETSSAISITIGTPGILVLDFGPDGTHFDPPATLTVKGANRNRNAVSLYLWDSVAGAWVKLDTPVNIGPDGTITVSIYHFSRYGMAD